MCPSKAKVAQLCCFLLARCIAFMRCTHPGEEAMLYGSIVTFLGWTLYGLVSPRFELKKINTVVSKVKRAILRPPFLLNVFTRFQNFCQQSQPLLSQSACDVLHRGSFRSRSYMRLPCLTDARRTSRCRSSLSRPPIEAPLPGAAVRRAVIGSPARVLALTISGDSLDSAAFVRKSRLPANGCSSAHQSVLPVRCSVPAGSYR